VIPSEEKPGKPGFFSFGLATECYGLSSKVGTKPGRFLERFFWPGFFGQPPWGLLSALASVVDPSFGKF